jgi:hypothetical protein
MALSFAMLRRRRDQDPQLLRGQPRAPGSAPSVHSSPGAFAATNQGRAAPLIEIVREESDASWKRSPARHKTTIPRSL